jgi:hypothetical protein
MFLLKIVPPWFYMCLYHGNSYIVGKLSLEWVHTNTFATTYGVLGKQYFISLGHTRA